MTKMNSIIAIFKRNLFNELILLLKNEGLKINRRSNLNNIEKKIQMNSIFIIDFDENNGSDRFLKHYEKNYLSLNAILLTKKNLKRLYIKENLRILKIPFKFNMLLELIINLQNSVRKNEDNLHIQDLIYFPKDAKFIHKYTKKIIKLTDLENKLIKFIIERKEGSEKFEILSSVWEHKTKLKTHTLESLIYRLRRKIEKDPNNPKILIQINKKYLINFA